MLSFIQIWNKILIHCCILLDFLCELYYDARIHEHQTSSKVTVYKTNSGTSLKVNQFYTKELTTNCNVGRFPHIIATVKPTQQVTTFWYNKYSRWYTVNSHNMTLRSDCKSCHNVDIPAINNRLKQININYQSHSKRGVFVARIKSELTAGLPLPTW